VEMTNDKAEDSLFVGANVGRRAPEGRDDRASGIGRLALRLEDGVGGRARFRREALPVTRPASHHAFWGDAARLWATESAVSRVKIR